MLKRVQHVSASNSRQREILKQVQYDREREGFSINVMPMLKRVQHVSGSNLLIEMLKQVDAEINSA